MWEAFVAKAGIAIASIWAKVAIAAAVVGVIAIAISSYNSALTRGEKLQAQVNQQNTIIDNRDQQIKQLKDDKALIEQITAQQDQELDAANKANDALRQRLLLRTDGGAPVTPYLQEVFDGIRGINSK